MCSPVLIDVSVSLGLVLKSGEGNEHILIMSSTLYCTLTKTIKFLRGDDLFKMTLGHYFRKVTMYYNVLIL